METVMDVWASKNARTRQNSVSAIEMTMERWTAQNSVELKVSDSNDGRDTYWSTLFSDAREFNRYDQNRDGLVDAPEYERGETQERRSKHELQQRDDWIDQSNGVFSGEQGHGHGQGQWQQGHGQGTWTTWTAWSWPAWTWSSTTFRLEKTLRSAIERNHWKIHFLKLFLEFLAKYSRTFVEE